MQEAIDYEVRRQIELIEDGGTVVQETRLYDPDQHETRSMRSKEDAQDYRYFPDPDLPPLVIGDGLDRTGAGADAGAAGSKKARFIRDYALPVADAKRVDREPRTRAYFEAAVKATAAKSAHRSEVGAGRSLRRAQPGGTRHRRAPVSAKAFAALLATASPTARSPARSRRTCSTRCGPAKRRATMPPTRSSPAKGLRQISDEGAIEKIVAAAIAANPAIVAEFKAGKEKAFNSLVGKVMAASKGKANPGAGQRDPEEAARLTRSVRRRDRRTPAASVFDRGSPRAQPRNSASRRERMASRSFCASRAAFHPPAPMSRSMRPSRPSTASTLRQEAVAPATIFFMELHAAAGTASTSAAIRSAMARGRNEARWA